LITDSGARGQGMIVTPDALALPEPRALASLREEPAAFEAIYDEHLDFVWRSARRLGVPEGHLEDVAQDVFVVVHRRLAEYDGRASLRGWLFGIVAHVVRNHRRRFLRKGAPCVEFDETSAAPASFGAVAPPHEAMEVTERVRLLFDLLNELDQHKREVLVLAQLEELSVPEIAASLGLNVNTASSRLRAARRAFEEAFARHRARSENEAGRRR
jgi:RNA polymerase sigma-70 factor (ECF subfamily)